MNALKKVITNKAVVTIASGLLCLAILAIAYNKRIKDQIRSTPIPIAKQSIPARTRITKDLIKVVNVPASMLTDNVIRDTEILIKKYSNYNTIIPAGSLFYTSSVIDEKNLPDSAWSNIPDGYTVVSFPVSTTTTFGNSIFPNTFIDLYLHTRDGDKIVYGKLIEGIKILAVKDEYGNHIFYRTNTKQKAQAFIFAVPEDLHLLFRKAYAVSGASSLIPVPRNKNYKSDNTEVSSEYLKSLILSKTKEVPLDEVTSNNTNDTNNQNKPQINITE